LPPEQNQLFVSKIGAKFFPEFFAPITFFKKRLCVQEPENPWKCYLRQNGIYPRQQRIVI
jgi:hypothetical protein